MMKGFYRPKKGDRIKFIPNPMNSNTSRLYQMYLSIKQKEVTIDPLLPKFLVIDFNNSIHQRLN